MALAVDTTMCEKQKSTSPGTLQVKSRWKTMSIEEKLDAISQLEKGEQLVEICCTVRRAYSRIRTVCDNAARIEECVKCVDNFKC